MKPTLRSTIRRRDGLIAAAFLAVASVVALLARGHFGTGQRLLGVTAGLLVMYYANSVPKALEPLARLKNPARCEALQRFVGWTMMFGGLGYALAFVLAPFDSAALLAAALLGSSLSVAIGRALWVRRLR